MIQMALQTLAFAMLFSAGIRRIHQQILERNVPKSSVDAARDSLPHFKSCCRVFGYWAACALVEAVLLEGIFELLEYTLF